MKKIHKWGRLKFGDRIEVLPICKVYNKTLAYKATTDIKKVTCERCLTKYKESHNEQRI